jgi:hypothetical protein
MKREFSQEELAEGWTLAPNELLLMMNKSGPGRLGFAALLKFFQVEARFPFHKGEVSEQLLPMISTIQATGASSLRAIAAELNAREIPTPRKLGEWSAVQVQRVMTR